MTRTLLAAVALTLAGAIHAAPPFADPMQPPNVSEGRASPSAEGGVRLESILIAPDRRLAVINGRQLAVGDRLEGMSVVRILESEVVVRSSEGEQTLRLVPEVPNGAIAPAKRERSK